VQRRRSHKYNVAAPEARRWNGRLYASKAEREYAQQLHFLLESHVIQLIQEQPTLSLGVPENVYRPDFRVVQDGEERYIDVKGVETAMFRRACKLWAAYGPAPLHIIKKKGARFITDRVIGRGQNAASRVTA